MAPDLTADDRAGEIEGVWSEQDTTPAAIEAALRKLLVEAHAKERGYAPARVLNLIIVVDRAVQGRDREPARAGRPLPPVAHDPVSRSSRGATTLDA